MLILYLKNYTCGDAERIFEYVDGGLQFVKGFGVSSYRNDEEFKISGTARSEVYQGRLAVNPSGTWLVHALLRANILSFYDIQPNGDLNLVT